MMQPQRQSSRQRGSRNSLHVERPTNTNLRRSLRLSHRSNITSRATNSTSVNRRRSARLSTSGNENLTTHDVGLLPRTSDFIPSRDSSQTLTAVTTNPRSNHNLPSAAFRTLDTMPVELILEIATRIENRKDLIAFRHTSVRYLKITNRLHCHFKSSLYHGMTEDQKSRKMELDRQLVEFFYQSPILHRFFGYAKCKTPEDWTHRFFWMGRGWSAPHPKRGGSEKHLRWIKVLIPGRNVDFHRVAIETQSPRKLKDGTMEWWIRCHNIDRTFKRILKIGTSFRWRFRWSVGPARTAETSFLHDEIVSFRSLELYVSDVLMPRLSNRSIGILKFKKFRKAYWFLVRTLEVARQAQYWRCNAVHDVSTDGDYWPGTVGLVESFSVSCVFPFMDEVIFALKHAHCVCNDLPYLEDHFFIEWGYQLCELETFIGVLNAHRPQVGDPPFNPHEWLSW